MFFCRLRYIPALAFLRITACSVILSIMLFSCVEPMSWSVNGRYLTFCFGNRLFLWDSNEETTKTLLEIDEEGIASCRFLPHGKGILYSIDVEDSLLMEFSLKTGTSRVVSDKCVLSPLKYTISQNGKYLYTIIEENGTWKIWRHRLWDPSLDILLYTFENEVCCPAINAGDNQLLLCTEHDGIYALCSLDLNTGTLTTLLEDTDKEYAYPQWIDGHRFLFQVGWDEPSEKESTLCIYDISSKIVQDLGTFIFDPLKPSLHPKGTAVIVTIYPDIEKDQSQILLIDIGTGKQTLLRPDACATAGALFSPCGEKVAYMESDAGWDSEEGLYYFKVLNLKTGDDKIIWSSRK